ncbi:MAG: AAA-ATPase-like protein, partial [Gammaproteobacteria bacterium]|nr:AAA-ATPase-like protein [Gammaproteobacteria bacterium]
KVFSVLNAEYSEHFGFTELEVDEALQKNNLQHLSTDIKAWYNGYHIGNTQIYNPWSIANCIFEKGSLQPYWLNTSDNTLIKQTIAHADALLKIECEKILEGKPVEALVDENITFADLNGSGDKLWTLLLFSGYLTSTRTELAGFEKKCLLQPPNKEIALLYSHVINAWFKESLGQQNYQYLLKSLVTGDLEEFLEILQQFLSESLSYFDVKGNAPEKFYHGFVMGLMVSLSDTHHVQSNKESGRGRYDVLLIPKDLTQLGIILEFKVGKKGIDLQAAANEALEQINQRGYVAELTQKNIKNILKMGLAFYGKEVALASE